MTAGLIVVYAGVALISLPVFLRPWIGVIVLVVLQIPLASSTTGLTSFEIAFSLLFIWTILAWAIKEFSVKNAPVTRTPFNGVIVLLLAACATTFFVAYLSDIGILDWLRGWYQFSLLLLFFPIVTEFRSRRRLTILVGAYLAVSTVVVVQAILITVRSGSLLDNPFMGESGTPFQSILYLWGVILAIALYSTGVQKLWLRATLIAIMTLHIWRLLIDFRRQPLMLLIIAIGLIMWLTWYNRRRIMRYNMPRLILKSALGMVLVGLLLLGTLELGGAIITAVVEGYANRINVVSLSRGLQVRLGTDLVALKDFIESPLWGRGFGYQTEFTFVIDQRLAAGGSELRERTVGNLHSLYAYLLFYGGLLVFIPAILLFIHGIRYGLRLLSRNFDSNFDLGLAIGSVAGMIVLIFLGLFSTKAMRTETWLFVAIALGFLVITSRNTHRLPVSSTSRLRRRRRLQLNGGS